jgi:hypothetical protein
MNTIDLKIIGHELVDMLRHAGGGHWAPAWLRVDESGAQRSTEACPCCGEQANTGTFELLHAYRRLGIVLPYMAAHVLAAHGNLEVPGAEIDPGAVDTLQTLLNHPEQRLAQVLVGLGAMAAPIRYVHAEHHLTKGFVACSTCGDRINMGHLGILNDGKDVLSLPYPALHALLEHRDARYEAESVTGEVSLEEVWAALAAPDLRALGKRLAGMLEFLGGDDPPPPGLFIEEHPLRGLESCTQCDARPNMGTFSLLRQALGVSMTLPYVAVHALVEHESAHYQGSLHDGWVDVPKLRRLLGDAPA